MQRMLYSCKVEEDDVFSFLSEVKRVKDGSRLGLAYYDRDDFCSSLSNSSIFFCIHSTWYSLRSRFTIAYETQYCTRTHVQCIY